VKFLTKYLTLWIILAAVLAFIFPSVWKPYGSVIPYMIGVIMLSMGLSMTPNDFKLVFTQPKAVIAGIVVLYVSMPLVGMAIGTLLNLAPMLTVGLILVGCTPTGSTSNVMTMLANGDKALSVTTSSISTLLAPIITPAMLMLYVGQYMPIDGWGLVFGILKIVIVPIVLGLLIHKIFEKSMKVILTVVPIATVVAVFVVISVVVSLNVERLASTAGMAVICCGIFTLCGLIIGYIAGKILRLPLPRHKAFTFIIGIQNTALAVSLAIQYFDPLAAVPGAILIVWASVFGSLVASVWASRTKDVSAVSEATQS
jgi:BASS family bile acid:Na+ symporter